MWKLEWEGVEVRARGVGVNQMPEWQHSDLLIQLKVCEGELHSLAHLLLLDVHATYVRVLRRDGVGNGGVRDRTELCICMRRTRMVAKR